MSPQRKKPPHEIPSWVPEGSRYFITINCHERGGNVLCAGDIPAKLVTSIPLYENLGKWHVYAMVVIPDHVHMIAVFNLKSGIRPVVSAWKRYFAQKCGIHWQSNFFEHRLRNDAEFTEKFYYVLNNPVRKGFVAR